MSDHVTVTLTPRQAELLDIHIRDILDSWERDGRSDPQRKTDEGLLEDLLETLEGSA